MKKCIIFSLVILYIFFSNNIYAVKARHGIIQYKQPDGSLISIYLHGNENIKYHTTLDGFLIKKDSMGFFRYATVNDSTLTIQLSDKKAQNKEFRKKDETEYITKYSTTNSEKFTNYITNRQISTKLQKSKAQDLSISFPTTGNLASLVILVNFKDRKFVIPNAKTEFDKLLNQTNYTSFGATGSARDYFMKCSSNQFSPTFDVIGPIDLPDSLAYYGKNNSVGDDTRPEEMIIKACKLADSQINFSNYDYNNDGYVDNIFVYYAGYNEAEHAPDETIWPHRSSLPNRSLVLDGKIIYDYACTSELKNASGANLCGIGTFCHEFGHVLGLVDYYHTTNDYKSTLSYWHIMDQGSYSNEGRTPPLYSAYERFYLNWLQPTVLDTAQIVDLEPLSESNKAFLIAKGDKHNLNGQLPEPKEFFLIENRVKEGFDSYLPKAGVLFWHIDFDENAWESNSPNNYSGSTQTSESHMRVYLQPASGNTTTPGTAFTSGSFKPTLWNGTNMRRDISGISINNNIANFAFRGGNIILPTPVTTDATDITNRSFTANWNTINDAYGYYLTVYSIANGTTTQTEGFDNGFDLSSDWTTNLTSLNTQSQYSGVNPPSLLFKKENDYLITPKYSNTVIGLKFDLKSIASTNSKLTIEGFDSKEWHTIDEITVQMNTSGIQSYSFDSLMSFNQFRFTYTKIYNSISIDDISVEMNRNIEYHQQNYWTTANYEIIDGLVSNRKHYYYVIAEDAYENKTPISNITSIVTADFPETHILRIEKSTSGNIFAFVKDVSIPLYIYDITGRTIANIKPVDNKVNLNSYIKSGGMYILKYGKQLNKVVLQ